MFTNPRSIMPPIARGPSSRSSGDGRMSRPGRNSILVLLIATVAPMGTDEVRAQCPPGWAEVTTLPTATSDVASALVVLDPGTGPALHAAQPTGVTIWDGTQTLTLPAPPFHVFDLEYFDDGGGLKLHAACIGAVMRFDNGAWSTAAVASGSVKDLHVFDDGTGNRLHAVGDFTSIDGNPLMTKIARYDGVSWSPYGGHVFTRGPQLDPGHLNKAMDFDDGTGARLYVTGVFDAVIGLFADNFSVRVGGTWVPVVLGPGASFGWDRMVVHDDGSGPALWLGGVPENNGAGTTSICRFDGSNATCLPLLTNAFQSQATIRGLDSMSFGGRSYLVFSGSHSEVTFSASYPQVAVGSVTAWDGTNLIPILPATENGGALAAFDGGNGPEVFVTMEQDGLKRMAPRPLAVSLDQPGGPGSPTFVSFGGLAPTLEHFGIFSVDACQVPGGGPYLGLCATDPGVLLWQASLPLQSPPFHFVPNAVSETYGPFQIAAGTTIDGVALQRTTAGILCATGVARWQIQ